MDGLARRRIVDAVTVSRLPIALAMVLLRRRRTAIAGLFLLGVATDLVDGRLARRFGTSSPRGARLDGAADAVFVAASAVAVAATVDRADRPVVVCAAGIVAATRIAALLVTRLRFGTWSVVHTHLNKASGLALAGVATSAVRRGRMPVGALGGVAVLAEVAAIEELAIVLVSADYDADRATLLART